MDSYNKHRGVLFPKPTKFSSCHITLKTQTIDTFFVGRNHPIDYNPALHKKLKEEYDVTADDIEMDLSLGSHEFDEKPAELSFETTLMYLVEQRQRTGKSLAEITHGAQIVCRRGVLNKIANAPYTKYPDFLFGVKRFHGVFFIKELSTVAFERKNARVPLDVRYLLPKFHGLLVKPLVAEDYKPPNIVSTWERMEKVFLAKIGSAKSSRCVTVFYGSEVDAIDKYGQVAEIKLQKGELNCYAPYVGDKLRKWYYQAKFVECDSIMMGFRNDNVVTHIERYDTEGLRNMAAVEDRWEPSCSYAVMMDVFSAITSFYHTSVNDNETLIVELSHQNQDIVYYIREDSVDKILPNHFTQYFTEDTFSLENACPTQVVYPVEPKKPLQMNEDLQCQRVTNSMEMSGLPMS